jgi:glycosyltransferase involved in cell wall biosynthesis
VSEGPARALAVLLAHDEEACIARTVREVRQALPGADVLVVDDGSADGTAREARAAGALVARHPINLGVSAAEATGLTYADRHGYGAVVRMDGDGQHDPAFAAALLAAVEEGADLVVGTRFGDLRSYESTAVRRAGNAFLAWVVSTLCRQRLTDPTSGFRAFSRRCAAFFARVHPHDYPEPESLLMAHRQAFAIRELPVRMRPRTTGRSSLTALRSAYSMVKTSLALTLELLRAR